ncbi:hypothetical protein, variant [Saprolegnia diclina VS20]|nr:hypothetical protein, variant [Saprolegnia diclina VS20]EQC35988.1 hypothetical protein, variant [Saprolegnia diclina VS20]|eukprot:XP_008610750.1 hypothetical protein, variant [Saprolegnia diclina VS20]
MWAVEMQSLAASTPDLVASDGGPVLRLCMLLCPNPFGAQFSALYQRYFAREGATIGVHFEWRVFDVGQLEFPTVALDEWAHGYLVCGGPGHDDDSLPLWHRSVVGFLAHLVSRHRRVGALGRGHSILAKALGGDVARVSPSRLDWNVLEEKVLSQQSVKTVVYAIPALHGDLVTCVPSAKVATSTPGPAYVTKFKTKTALSFDGHPECGTFILHMLARYLHAPATDAVPECAWPRGDALVARKLVQHYLAAQKAVDGPETVLSRRLPLRRMRIFAHKSCDPMLEFLSDTNEYLAFAFSENVDVVVLPICLSADKHPIVFGSTHLEALTDLAAIFPSYVRAHPPRVAVSDLSLAELKALTILHAFPNASGLKSPRGRGGYAGASESNRLQTLTTVLQFLARLHTAQRTSPLEIAFTFPEENESTFSAHDRDHIDELYTILRGALRVLHADMDDAIHVVSRDMPFLSTLHKLHPRWRTVLVVPRSIATPLRMTLQHDALAIAHFADAILIPKSHPVLLPDENNDSIAQIYHRAGVHVYVDLNDPYPTSLSLVKEHIKCQCLRVDGVFVSNPHTALDGFRLFASGHSYVDEVYEDIRQSFGLVAAMAEHEKLQRQIEPQNITYAHHAYQFPGNESASWSQRLRHLSPVMDHVLRLIAVDGDVEMERQVRGNYYSAPKRALPARPVTGRPLPLAVTAPVLGTSQQGRRCRTRVPGKRHTIGSLAAPCSPVVDRSEDIRSPERVMSVNQRRSVAPPSKSPLVTARRLRPPNR